MEIIFLSSQWLMDEKRKHDRFQFMLPVKIFLEHSKKTLDCMSYDLSQGGISFVTDSLVKLTGNCLVEGKVAGFRRTGKLVSIGKVADSANMTKYGVEFNIPLDFRELKTYLTMAKREVVKTGS